MARKKQFITREQFDEAAEAVYGEIAYQNRLPRRTADEALGLMKLVHARRLASLEGLLSQLGQAVPADKTMGAAGPEEG
jgi:hypothetical protein